MIPATNSYVNKNFAKNINELFISDRAASFDYFRNRLKHSAI